MVLNGIRYALDGLRHREIPVLFELRRFLALQSRLQDVLQSFGVPELLRGRILHGRSFLQASVIAARKFLHVSGGSGVPLRLKEGRRNAERRTLVTAAAYFPDRRETEAHGNASQRPAAAFFKTSVRSSGDLAHGDFAPLPVPVQPHQWQGPVVSPDGNPRPPDDAEGRPLHARRRRIPPRATSVPATPL
jgi:hypothetical protein